MTQEAFHPLARSLEDFAKANAVAEYLSSYPDEDITDLEVYAKIEQDPSYLQNCNPNERYEYEGYEGLAEAIHEQYKTNLSDYRLCFDAGRKAAHVAPVVLPEPFGYFKCDAYGWMDCAETDEGARPLYEAPQPQVVPGFNHVAAKKLKELQARGYTVAGYSIEKTSESGAVERGFITSGGFVGWWQGQHTNQQPQADALDTERLDFLTRNIGGAAFRKIGVEWAEHADARRAIDAAIAAAKEKP